MIPKTRNILYRAKSVSCSALPPNKRLYDMLLPQKMFTEHRQVQVCSPFPVLLCQLKPSLQCYHDILLYHTLFKGTQNERKHQQQHKKTCIFSHSLMVIIRPLKAEQNQDLHNLTKFHLPNV